jgi:hypothetical protein
MVRESFEDVVDKGLYISYRNRLGLLYELQVYKHIRKNLIDVNICPFFNYMYNYGINCSYNDMLGLINSTSDAELKFKRSNYFMLELNNQDENRPPIDLDENIIMYEDYMNRIKRDNDPFTYNFSIIEKNKGKKFLQFLYDIEDSTNFNIVLPVLFQIMFACRALYLSGITHNDLHQGNIFITQLKENVNMQLCSYENKTKNCYTMLTNQMIYIYDFDEAYCKSLGNNEKLFQEAFIKGNFTNKLVEIRDMLRVLIDLYNLYKTALGDSHWILRVIQSFFLNQPISTMELDIQDLVNQLLVDMYPPNTYCKYINNDRFTSVFKNSHEIFNSIGMYMEQNMLINNNKPDVQFKLDERYFDNNGKAVTKFPRFHKFDSLLDRIADKTVPDKQMFDPVGKQTYENIYKRRYGKN